MSEQGKEGMWVDPEPNQDGLPDTVPDTGHPVPPERLPEQSNEGEETPPADA